MLKILPSICALLVFSNVALATLPQVDFDRMGKVGLAGAFAGLDLFQNSTPAVAFDPSTSTLLSRAADGSLSRIGSTNSGGRISAGCALGSIFYLAGSFSTIGGTSASNIASYTPASGAFAALGSNGPNGEVDSVFCDESGGKVWVGGSFSSPGSSVAVWDTKALSWSQPPFKGLAGAGDRVLSITANSSLSILFFAGSFVTSFQGNGSSVLNGTNNPNVPFSAGATPFSSSLVPIPLQNAEVEGSPSSSNPQFSNIQSILCPAGADGPGNTWLAADSNTAVVTVRTFSSISANGVRLGNTFITDHGTTGFRYDYLLLHITNLCLSQCSVTSIPDNNVQTLHYIDPTTGQNQTCSNPCPLLTDPSIPYQDFLFDSALSITGVQIALTKFTGSSPGLHLLQLLSSGAFASAVDNQNSQSCFAPNPSNTSFTGNWVEKDASTGIAGTTQSVLVSSVAVGTSPAQGPSFTWMPYVSASGDYDVNLLVPGCTNFQDCPLRTSVQVTVFPGQGLPPSVTTVSQQGTSDTVTLIYSGPVVPSSPNFVTTVEMTLADNPTGSGQGGQFELVADRVQMVLRSANISASGGAAGNGSATGGTQGTQNGFGFFEWPLSSSASSSVDGTQTLPNSSKTALDAIGLDLFSAVGGNSGLASSATTAIAAVAHHPSSAVLLGGNFTLSSGTASGSANIVAFKNGALAGVAGNGLNGPVSAFVLVGDQLFVGGSFRDTSAGSLQGALGGVAIYNVQKNQWSALQAGVNGVVTSLGYADGQVQVAGNFTTLLTTPGAASGVAAAGFAAWNVEAGAWVNSGGFVVGSMTFVGNGTAPGKGQQQTEFIAGNVAASLQFGASGLVMLQNGNSEGPQVTALGVQLDGAVEGSTGSSTRRRRSHARRGPSAWIPHITLSGLFARQSTSQLVPLPAAPPAPAPAVLAGAFWANSSSSHEVAIIGGNFSFTPASGSPESQGVAVYDPESTTISALVGSQVNGTVRALLVVENQLFVGGQFTLQGTTVNGFAIYDLATQQWAVSNLQALEPSSGSSVVVRSITTSSAKSNTIIVAGSFAQAGGLQCQAICSLDISSVQWNSLGNGIQGEVASVAYAEVGRVALHRVRSI